MLIVLNVNLNQKLIFSILNKAYIALGLFSYSKFVQSSINASNSELPVLKL